MTIYEFNKIIVCVLISFLFSTKCVANNVTHGRVVKIIDGDSIILSIGSKKIETRLWGIDAPEWRQPYATEAKKYLKRNVLGKNVEISTRGTDKYGRMLALIHFNSETINNTLVKEGYAWVHPYYCREKVCKGWRDNQNEAKKEGRGLWNQFNPTSPWKYKSLKK